MYDKLLKWKEKEDHKCLVLKGQRHTGKTYIVKQFGKDQYENTAYIDFTESPEYKELFSRNPDVDEIIKGIKLFTGNRIDENTLIILDEIQECPCAHTSLKYFTIDGRYDVIALDSFFRTSYEKDDSQSIDSEEYEEHISMYSMDFEEFLWALGIHEDIVDNLKNSIKEKNSLNPAVLGKYESLFRDYMIIGGMPESVELYVKTEKYADSEKIIVRLLESYRENIKKYTSDSETIKTIECFESIPFQLSKPNKKFMYSSIKNKGFRKAADRYSENILWIMNTGFVNPCYALDEISLPLEAHEIRNSFRLYLSDTGILSHMYDFDALIAVFRNDTKYNFGAITENIIAECLMKNDITPRYYIKNKDSGRMELDFVIVLGNELTVIEVKSGRTRDYPSLNKVDSYFNVDRKIVFENGSIHSDGDVEYYPLFAAAFINELKNEISE